MSFNIQNRIKIPLIFVAITAFLFGSFCFGMFHKTSMAVEKVGMTDMVSINTEQSCCGEKMSQHLQPGINTFLVIPHDLRNNLALLALTLLMSLVVIRSLFSRVITDFWLLSNQLYSGQKPNPFIFNPLKLAFARGILNPKLY